MTTNPGLGQTLDSLLVELGSTLATTLGSTPVTLTNTTVAKRSVGSDLDTILSGLQSILASVGGTVDATLSSAVPTNATAEVDSLLSSLEGSLTSLLGKSKAKRQITDDLLIIPVGLGGALDDILVIVGALLDILLGGNVIVPVPAVLPAPVILKRQATVGLGEALDEILVTLGAVLETILDGSVELGKRQITDDLLIIPVGLGGALDDLLVIVGAILDILLGGNVIVPVPAVLPAPVILKN